MKAGQPEKAFEIMRKEIARQQSGRGRFERTLQLVELCVAAGKDAIAQPLLDDLVEAIEAHKLDDWEDKEMVAAALATVMKISKKVQDDAGEKQKALRAHLPARSGSSAERRIIAMARPQGDVTVTLSVLDRLIDHEPEARWRLPSRRSQSVRVLKAAVQRDLEWLLNTRRIFRRTR